MNPLELGEDTFKDAIFPLPYRVLTLAGLGILGWATNMHGLDFLGVDVASAMDLWVEEFPQRTPTPNRSSGFRHTIVSLYGPVYRIFAAFSLWCFVSWSIFRIATQGDVLRIDMFGFIPALTIVSLLFALAFPLNITFKIERNKFLRAIHRCLTPHPETSIFFSDVVFADIGTSFAKVIADMWLCIWMFVPGNSILAPPIFDGWQRWATPFIMSFPFLVRLRQCVAEYRHPSNTSTRPLFNALKYATSFPVIFLSAAQRYTAADLVGNKDEVTSFQTMGGEWYIYRLWLFAAVVNSIYSFWWDVTNDWGLNALKFDAPRNPEWSPTPQRLHRLHSTTLIERESMESISSGELNQSTNPGTSYTPQLRTYPLGLRPTLLYPIPVYPLLVFFNLILRMTWSAKLSSHLQTTRDGSFSFFWLEVAELVRRWLWVFLRVEWEVIKKTEGFKLRSDGVSSSQGNYELINATTENVLVFP